MAVFSSDIREIMNVTSINCVLDVGANVGQFGRFLRDEGFSGTLISFEPIASVYSELSRATVKEPDWYCRRTALGESDGIAEINVSKNYVSSSLLTAKAWSVSIEEGIAELNREIVPLHRLETIWSELPIPSLNASIMLKIDVQGLELQVLRGLGDRVSEITLFLLEASLIPVYEGEPKFEDVVAELRAIGLHPVWIGPGWSNKHTRQVFQCDIVFARRSVL
jgi:FkbM family methyltransferase